jgi:hypothetical protein
LEQNGAPSSSAPSASSASSGNRPSKRLRGEELAPVMAAQHAMIV